MARGAAELQQLGARHVGSRSGGASARPRRAVRPGVAGRVPLVAVLHAALVVARSIRRPLRDRRSRAHAAHRRRYPAVVTRVRRRGPRVAHSDRAVLRTDRQRDRAAPVPRWADRAGGAARAPAVAAALRGHRRADAGHQARRCDGRVLADRLRSATRRLRRDLHRRDLRQRARRRPAGGWVSA